MFTKSARLTRAQFSEFFKVGKRFHFPHLTIIYTPSPTLQVAVVVGKKVAKKAVRRNTLRRRLYAGLRRELSLDATGVFIVIVKPSFQSLTRAAADEFLTASIAQVRKSA